MNDRTKMMARCRMTATQDLIKRHKDEFRELLAAEYADKGIEVNMRNTSVEAKIERLKAQIETLQAVADLG
jgi:hypothetical protein